MKEVMAMSERKEKKEKKENKENEEKISNRENKTRKETKSSHEKAEKKEEKLKKELEECLQRAKEFENYAKRSKAALENLRREKDEEIRDAIDYANKNMVEKLVYVLDDIERLLEHFEDKKSLEYGALKMIHDRFKEILVSEGLKEIKSDGKFDPFDHEAIERVESPTHEDWDIVEVVEKGYKFRSRLIRPAKVKVAVHVKTNVSSGANEENEEKGSAKKDNEKDGE
jgi:molecular chaperone GrpE